jgi:hypothetical protein
MAYAEFFCTDAIWQILADSRLIESKSQPGQLFLGTIFNICMVTLYKLRLAMIFEPIFVWL